LDKSQKIILISLISISVITWLFSIEQPDMMEAMMTLNPIAVTIFTISWTIGMAAMMFPAIIPMVLLYNRLISNDQNNNNNNNNNKNDNLSLASKFSQHTDNLEDRENRQHSRSFAHLSKRDIKTSGFVGTYLLVWAITGVMLLVFWSIIMNSLFIGHSAQDFAIVSGILLIVSGIYQFSPLKERCLGYCESPLSFFMKRWKGNQLKDGLKMGLYHGMYCLGCCWPYFLLMIALGWMNILWMGMFAAIIFAEKVWSKGIWIARGAGIVFVVAGFLSITEIIPITTEEGGMHNSHNEMNRMMVEDSIQGKDENNIRDNNMDMDMDMS
jgi:predicted metal-binding membrane protein